MSDPHFLTLEEVLRIHRYQIDVFGGADGPVDESERIALGVAAHTVEKDEVVAFFTRLIAGRAP